MQIIEKTLGKENENGGRTWNNPGEKVFFSGGGDPVLLSLR